MDAGPGTARHASPDDLTLVYGLEDRPDAPKALLAAIQHLLASVVAVITPPLLIGTGLGLGEHTAYLISMALVASGIGSFIQSKRIGPVGAGLLTLQGTSFSFVGIFIAAGTTLRGEGATDADIIALIVGVSLLGSLVPMGLSAIAPHVRRVFSPAVTGTVLTTIGISLVGVGFDSLAGGKGAADYGAPANLSLGLFVIAVIVALSIVPNVLVRVSAVLGGLVAGCLAAMLTGLFDFAAFASTVDAAAPVAVPMPFRYGVHFDLAVFVSVAVIYLASAIESVGDMTANSVISRQPVEGPVYMRRVRGGLLGDGVSCLISAVINAPPVTTFAQNNGVIQLTGIASRHVALYFAPILVLLGLFPPVAAVFTAIPAPVIGGAMVMLFGSIAVAGIRVLAGAPMDRKRILTLSVSFGLAFGVSLAPAAVEKLPDMLRTFAESPIAVAGLAAIMMTVLLPEPAGRDNPEARDIA